MTPSVLRKRVMAVLTLLLVPGAPGAAAQGASGVAVSPASASTEVSASAGIAPDTVTLGDHFRVRVRVTTAPEAVVDFPAFRLVEPVEQADTLRVTRDDDGSWTATYTLAAWTVSDSLVGNFPVRVRSGQEAARNLQIRVALPVVRSVLPADSSLHLPRPARPPLPVSLPSTQPRGWVTPAILLLVLAATIVWLLRRRHGEATSAPADPRAAALSALDDIARERLPERGEQHEYHVRTSRVLREYVEAMGGGGEDLTSAELIATLRRQGTERSLVEGLAALLREADRVKFGGRAAPQSTEITREHGGALRRWIESWPPPASSSAGSQAEAA